MRSSTPHNESGEPPSGKGDGLARGTPGEVGVDSAVIEAFLDDVEAAGLELHSFMIHRGGKVVVDGWWWPYRPDEPRIMHSLAKSFAACAIGLALEEGHFKLTDKVVSFFPDHVAEDPDPKLAAMTVEDLLTMRTGQGEETSGSIWRGIGTSWISEFFKIPIVHQPGTTYVYTSAASYMLGAILFRTTGETFHSYLKPRLFEPLGIENAHWDIGPDGFNPGGNGLFCKPADALKLGILHAQGGVWEGKRILPEAWVAAATRPKGDANYGYHWVATPQGDFRALGVFVQMAQVFPKQGATLAIMAAIPGSAMLLPLLYKHFPGGFRDGPLDNAAADARLKARLEGYFTQKRLVSEVSNLPSRISGRSFRAEPNPQGITALRFDFTDEACTLELTDGDGPHRIVMALDGWSRSRISLPGQDLHHGYKLENTLVVSGARWRDADTLEMTWIFANSAFCDTVLCRFDGDQLHFDRSVNVNSGQTRHPTIVAHLQEDQRD